MRIKSYYFSPKISTSPSVVVVVVVKAAAARAYEIQLVSDAIILLFFCCFFFFCESFAKWKKNEEEKSVEWGTRSWKLQ